MRRSGSTIWRAGGVPRNTLLTSGRTLIRFAVGIALLPILLHALGSSRAGLFLFATSLTGYFTAVELGLATSLTKYVAEFRAREAVDELNDIVRATALLMTGIGTAIAAGLAIFGLTGATALFHEASVRPEARATMLVAAVVALLYWPTRPGVAALEGLERYDLSAVIQTAGMLAMLGGIWGASLLDASVPCLVAVSGAVLVAQNVAAGALAWPHLTLRRGGRWHGAHLRPVIAFGGNLFVIGMADTLVYSLDRTVVAAFVGPAAIVVYEIAVRLQSGVRSIAALSGGALISTISRLQAQRRDERMRELVLIGSLLGVLVTTPVAVLTMTLARPLIGAWVGHDYVQYAYLAQIFVSYWLVHSNTGVLGSAVTGLGRVGVFALLAGGSAVVILGLSIALTAEFGTIGVILGTVIPSWIGLPIWLHFALRHVRIPWVGYLRSVVVPAYSLIGAWSAAVLVAVHFLPPEGIVATLGFAAAAEGVFALAALPLVRGRWQRVTTGGGSPVSLAPAHGATEPD